jgi:hypothetical protein
MVISPDDVKSDALVVAVRRPGVFGDAAQSVSRELDGPFVAPPVDRHSLRRGSTFVTAWIDFRYGAPVWTKRVRQAAAEKREDTDPTAQVDLGTRLRKNEPGGEHRRTWPFGARNGSPPICLFGLAWY